MHYLDATVRAASRRPAMFGIASRLGCFAGAGRPAGLRPDDATLAFLRDQRRHDVAEKVLQGPNGIGIFISEIGSRCSDID
ncbi:hypothetical protein JMUB5695_01450 [Mycobacterium heckeshornense]|uniref:Uncharacterized protein n=1 Tax=Mycobacterium heckeshornense TaxID=110505 RepID=A0A7R7YQU9_9MYCO|nr:hypothetical protein MHEC_12890 [Mycobacterium heckeshornense]BCQ08025.1 hypothetical protein JMUB5695_01450 [Mycobacterium heckeshornense]